MTSPLSRSARGEINQLPCVFALALGQRCAVCSLSLHDKGELLCTQPLARAACATLHGTLRDKSRFALGLSTPSHANHTRTELRLQCGGLSGLRNVLDQEAMSIDVQRLLERLQGRLLEQLPWEPILHAISVQRPGK